MIKVLRIELVTTFDVCFEWSTVGMLTDIRKNPDNKLSGYIRIINYPFNYPSTWRLILFMHFLCSFSKFLRHFAKNFVHLFEYIQNISGWT